MGVSLVYFRNRKKALWMVRGAGGGGQEVDDVREIQEGPGAHRSWRPKKGCGFWSMHR